MPEIIQKTEHILTPAEQAEFFIINELDAEKEKYLKNFKCINNLRNATEIVYSAINTFKVDNFEIRFNSCSSVINLYIYHPDSFMDILPILEFFEENDYPCTSTNDLPDYGDRVFRCGNIHVWVNVSDNGKN